MIGPQVRRAIIEAGKLGFTRDDRLAFAEYLVGHEGSWSTMTEDDGRVLSVAMRALPATAWLFRDRREISGDGHTLPSPAMRRTA